MVNCWITCTMREGSTYLGNQHSKFWFLLEFLHQQPVCRGNAQVSQIYIIQTVKLHEISKEKLTFSKTNQQYNGSQIISIRLKYLKL